MAMTNVKWLNDNERLVYLTGGAYEIWYYKKYSGSLVARDYNKGSVLIHKCARRSKAQDVLALTKAEQYIKGGKL